MVKEHEVEAEEEEDTVCAQWSKSLFKVKNVDIDDTVGAMYDAPYYGRVISKTEDSVKV